MKRLLAVTIGLALLLAARPAAAQDRFGIELGGGTAFATQELGDADLGTGFGFEATVAYRLMPHLSAYGGWGWNHFAAEESFAGTNVDVEETGYTFGVRFAHPLGASPLGYFVEAGGIYNHLEFENDEGDLVADSGHGLGWQAGGGLMLTLSEHWRLMPGVRYRFLSRDIEIDEVSTAVDLSYVTVRVGLLRTF